MHAARGLAFVLAALTLGGCQGNGAGSPAEAGLMPGTPFGWIRRHANDRQALTRGPLPGPGWSPKVGGKYARFDPIIAHHAHKRGLPSAFVRAVVDVESGFNPRATSHCGAAGLMQLMPKTAQGLGVSNRYDPAQNIAGGTLFLRRLARRFGGSLVLTTAAYNAGPGAVEKYRGVPPYKETRRYVNKVLRRYRAYTLLQAQAAAQ